MTHLLQPHPDPEDRQGEKEPEECRRRRARLAQHHEDGRESNACRPEHERQEGQTDGGLGMHHQSRPRSLARFILALLLLPPEPPVRRASSHLVSASLRTTAVMAATPVLMVGSAAGLKWLEC